jgi:hypothetical protein
MLENDIEHCEKLVAEIDEMLQSIKLDKDGKALVDWTRQELFHESLKLKAKLYTYNQLLMYRALSEANNHSTN